MHDSYEGRSTGTCHTRPQKFHLLSPETRGVARFSFALWKTSAPSIGPGWVLDLDIVVVHLVRSCKTLVAQSLLQGGTHISGKALAEWKASKTIVGLGGEGWVPLITPPKSDLFCWNIPKRSPKFCRFGAKKVRQSISGKLPFKYIWKHQCTMWL